MSTRSGKRVMSIEHQQLFTNVLRDCLGLDPLYSDKEQGLVPQRRGMRGREQKARRIKEAQEARALIAQGTKEGETADVRAK